MYVDRRIIEKIEKLSFPSRCSEIGRERGKHVECNVKCRIQRTHMARERTAQAHLRDMAGSVSGHRNKANITIKQVP